LERVVDLVRKTLVESAPELNLQRVITLFARIRDDLGDQNVWVRLKRDVTAKVVRDQRLSCRTCCTLVKEAKER